MPNTYVLKIPSKLLLGKDIFIFPYVALEYETSISIWEFEILIVVLPSFQLPTRLYSQNTKENDFINEL